MAGNASQLRYKDYRDPRRYFQQNMRTRSLFAVFSAFLSLAAFSGATQEMPSRTLETGRGTSLASGSLHLTPNAPAMVDVSGQARAKSLMPAEDRPGLIRVGDVVDVQSPAREVMWRALPGGRAVAHLEVQSAGAAGIRTKVVVPDGIAVSVLRATSLAGKVESVTVDNNARELWTPYTDGEKQTIEIEIAVPSRAGRTSLSNIVQVASVMHFKLSPNVMTPAKIAKDISGTCNPDVSCTSNDAVLDAAIQERKKSIALINFMSSGSSYICTATLINTDKFPRAFMLTADHCIFGAAEAASITAFWFKENRSCGQLSTSGTGVQVGGGAKLLLANTLIDAALIEMNSPPPEGAVYSGWNAAPLAAGDAIVSISHPRGDPMKFAQGSYQGAVGVADKPLPMYGIKFTRGVIEGGSSGSGLFTLSDSGSLQLRATLSGMTTIDGGLSCGKNTDHGIYARFEVFYQNIRRIIGNNETGSDQDPETITGARDIPLGGGVSAGIDTPGDLDFFRIPVQQPGILTVRSTGGKDLAAALLDANGSKLVANGNAEVSSKEFGITYRVDPGTYYLNVGHFDPAATGAYQVSASLANLTENYTDIWYSVGQNGWGLQLNHQGDFLFGAVFAYDLDGNSLWLIMSRGERQADGSYLGKLYRVTGPPFHTTPWPAASTFPMEVGTMHIAFRERGNLALLTYTVNGVRVAKVVNRFRYTPDTTTCTFSSFDRSTALNVTDLWYTPNEDGWGVNVIQQGDFLFVTLYTYDLFGNPMWLVMSRGEKQSGAAGTTYVGELYRNTGPPYNSRHWLLAGPVTMTKVGTMSFSFTNGNEGTLVYDYEGIQVTKPIKRFVFASPMPECSSKPAG
jgi:lysyl endopeptidase